MNPDIYLDSKANNVAIEGSVNRKVMVTPLLRISYDDGIFAYYEGAEFPQKGVSPVEVMTSVNLIKAFFMGFFRIRFSIVSVLQAFTFFGNRIMAQYFLKDEYRTAGTRELDRIVCDFAFSLTSNRDIASQFARLFSHLIEYDNAYRLRFIDIASETTKEKLLKNPRKEIKRLFGLLVEREVYLGESIVMKFRWITKFLLFILLIPRFRKAFKFAIGRSHWDRMCWDNIDKYWACLRTDYNFMGMTYKSRMKLLESIGYSLPVQKEMQI